jgi:hypothetical protein
MASVTQNSKLKTQNSKRWVWFFLLLGTLTVSGVVIGVWSNLQQQLTPEKLAAARAQWTEKGPRDYELDYEVKRGDRPDPSPQVGEKYTVIVKDGKAVSPPPPGRFGSLDDFFDWIEQRLRADREPGAPRVFAVLTFHGDELHYVRSVMTTRERIEITAKFHPPTSSPASDK